MRRRHQKAQSRLPPVYDPRNPFNTLGAGSSIPTGIIVPGSGTPVQPQVMGPPRVNPALPQYVPIPPGHYANPLENMVAAAARLAALPIDGDSPTAVETRRLRELWRSKRHTLIAGTGSIQPLVQAGARVIADTWSQRPAQVMSNAMTCHLVMARLTTKSFTRQTKTERGKGRSRRLG